MNGLRIEFRHIHPEQARQFLLSFAAGSHFAPVPPRGRRFADIEEACDFALSQATRLPKWTDRLRHPRSVRLVIQLDKYQPPLYHRMEKGGAARTALPVANPELEDRRD